MNIIKMSMNITIILLLAVRICEDSDNRGSDKRGYTVYVKKKFMLLVSVLFLTTPYLPYIGGQYQWARRNLNGVR